MSFKPSLQDFHAKALSDYGIDDIWPESVLKAAKIASDKLTEDKDYLEEFPFVTIDGEDAKDFDDAISIERLEKIQSQLNDMFHDNFEKMSAGYIVEPLKRYVNSTKPNNIAEGAGGKASQRIKGN